MTNGHRPAQRCEDREYIHSWLNEVDRDADPEAGNPDTQRWRPHGLAPISHDRPVSAMSGHRWRKASSSSEIALRPIIKSPAGSSSCDGSLPAPPSSLSEKENVYVKRPRRKTKDARYDTKRAKTTREKPEHAASKPRKRKDRKQELRSGRDVMKNFTSNAVSYDRVTVSSRPRKRQQTALVLTRNRSSQVSQLVFSPMEERQVQNTVKRPPRF